MLNLLKLVEDTWLYRCDRCGWESQKLKDIEVLKSSPPYHRCREDFHPKKKK